MFINPKELIENKIITYPENFEITDHWQPNGLDIDCAKVFNINFDIYPIVGKKISVKGKPEEEGLIELQSLNSQGWILQKGKTYTFDSSFEINIPEGMCGWVIGRSSFNRQGIFIRSSLFDQGFKGTISGTIYCFNNIVIEEGVRIAQIVMCRSDKGGLMYNGQWQNGNT